MPSRILRSKACQHQNELMSSMSLASPENFPYDDCSLGNLYRNVKLNAIVYTWSPLKIVLEKLGRLHPRVVAQEELGPPLRWLKPQSFLETWLTWDMVVSSIFICWKTSQASYFIVSVSNRIIFSTVYFHWSLLIKPILLSHMSYTVLTLKDTWLFYFGHNCLWGAMYQ